MALRILRGTARKEGRVHDLFSQKRLKTTVFRLLTISIFTIIIFTLFHSLSSEAKYISEPEDGTKEVEPHRAVERSLPQQEIEEIEVPVETLLPERAILKVQKPQEEQDGFIPQAEKEGPESETVLATEATEHPKTASKKDIDLEIALKHVLSLRPSYLTSRSLLSIIPGTGREKLYEIGLRARAYRQYLEAWEALHIIEIDSSLYIREDIIHYLRNHQEFATGLTESYADTIRAYEQFRHFIKSLGNLLFPMTAPYFPDHMSLHTHIARGSRGIVLTGGDKQAPYMLTSITTFRRLGCNLPIEILCKLRPFRMWDRNF